jgi:hypothetical protein
MYAFRPDRRRSFAGCRHFLMNRSMTDSVVNATPLTHDPTGHTTKTVIIASTLVAGIRKMHGFRPEVSSPSPAFIYSVTNTVE